MPRVNAMRPPYGRHVRISRPVACPRFYGLIAARGEQSAWGCSPRKAGMAGSAEIRPGRVPDLQTGLAGTARRDLLPVRAERHASCPADVGRRAPEPLAGLRVPDP